ncbi:hypothetical protein [Butyricimonas synergistica]|uniref:hypothetical protein n=1 Tax=Butyricimonas synergistica TaxID=544644 RepID=UPI00036BFE9A|nr:hypothetical protein [Butyricimonas synergistica]
MRNLLYSLIMVCVTLSCHDIAEGYLFVNDAGYDPDSLLVRTDLDSGMVKGPNPSWEYFVSEFYDWGHKSMTWEQWVEMLHEMGEYEEIDVPGKDYDRAHFDIPWVSTAIQGVQGTNPIYVSIAKVTTDKGDVDKFMEYVTVRGDGTFTVPFKHEIPSGRYKVSLHFEGPGHSADFENIFTIIIQ